MPVKNPLLFRVSLFAVILTLVVIVLGAYVRLSHAGLGCPDWPGCYGHLDVPATEREVQLANDAYPERPVETAKAWKEMIHRYVASLLGLVIVSILCIAWAQCKNSRDLLLPGALLVIVIFQGLLGMWTVTLLLKPAVVTAHLLGGMTTLALLWWLALRYSGWPEPDLVSNSGLKTGLWLSVTCLLALIVQIALGGWTSTNYAALACYGFPQCNQQWWPEMDFADAFVLWRGLGIDYEGGVLDHPARVAIHMTHRFGALLLSALILYMVFYLFRLGKKFHLPAILLISVLFVQISLGIVNVSYGLPLLVATAHNGVAALLILVLLSILYYFVSMRSQGRAA